MNTFLPFPDFAESARVLDYRRLGKQRVECLQILTALTRGGGWANHPAARMWAGHKPALCLYAQTMVDEWVSRGYRNSMCFLREAREHEVEFTLAPTLPPWLGDPVLHASHRSNLLRKDPVHYGQFGWAEPHDLEYVWPI